MDSSPLWTFAEAIGEIGRVTRRPIRYVQVSEAEYAAALAKADLPPADLITYLFREVLDGRNAWAADGVTRALGRAPREFADYVRDTAATGVWTPGGDGSSPPRGRSTSPAS